MDSGQVWIEAIIFWHVTDSLTDELTFCRNIVS